MTVTGVGYEGRTLAELVAALTADRVDVVVDIRLRAASRRPGMAKTSLRAGLAAAGIAYEHLPALGNPAANRGAYADPADDAPRAAYAAGLAEPAARRALARVRELSAAGRVALLCVEADGARCHRAQVLAAV